MVLLFQAQKRLTQRSDRAQKRNHERRTEAQGDGNVFPNGMTAVMQSVLFGPYPESDTEGLRGRLLVRTTTNWDVWGGATLPVLK